MPKRVITMVKAPTPRALAASKPPAKPLAVTTKYVSDLAVVSPKTPTAAKPFLTLGKDLGYKLTRKYSLPANTNLIIGKSGSKNENGNIVINGGYIITIGSGSSITFVSNATLDQRQFLNCKIIGSSTSKKGALKGTGTIFNGTTGIVEIGTKLSKTTGIKINTTLKQTYLSDAAYSQFITDRGLNMSGISGYELKNNWTLPLNTNVTIGYVSNTNNKNGGELLFKLNNSAPMYYTITVPTSSSITFLPNADLIKAGAMNLYLYDGRLVYYGKLKGTGTIMVSDENHVVGTAGNKASDVTIMVEGSAPML